MRIGILGGTYNPPHTGHLHAAVAARDSLKLDRVILLPSSIPPHKTMPKSTPDAEARLAMTRLAAADIGAEVSDLEIRRGGTSYTADTLADIDNYDERNWGISSYTYALELCLDAVLKL